jgi:hypothetical protein
MTDTHMEIWEMEKANERGAASFEAWAARLEKILGFSIDGDEKTDGYSVDGCLEMYRQGKRPLDAAHAVLWRKHGLHRSV